MPHYPDTDYDSEEEECLQEEYEEECMKDYPLTWELDEYELDHSYSNTGQKD